MNINKNGFYMKNKVIAKELLNIVSALEVEVTNELYEKLIKEIRQAGLHVRMKLCEDYKKEKYIVIECGHGYPDEMVYAIDDITEKFGLIGDQVMICADASGDTLLERPLCLNGGPQRFH